MATASINGFQMRYQSTGAGTPVVFLHGLGSSADDWLLQVPAFGERFRVITTDLRGHGRSPYRGALVIEQMADDVAALLTEIGAGAAAGGAHVVGLSMGGCVALAVGLRHPPLARSVTLVNTFAKYRSPGVGGLGRALRRLWLLQFRPIRAVAEFVAHGLFPKPEQAPLVAAAVASLSQNSRETYWAAIRALMRFDARAALAGLQKPVLVVMGDRDQTVPRAAGEYLARHIPGARALVLADSGHASPIDQAEAFNAAVLAFLQDVEALKDQAPCPPQSLRPGAGHR